MRELHSYLLMFSHRAIPVCTLSKTTKTRRNYLGPTLPHAAYLYPQVTILCQFLSMLPTDDTIGRTADISKKTGVSLPVSQTDVRSVGFDLPCSGDGCIPQNKDVVHLHKPIRLMPVPLALHCNIKMPTIVPVNDAMEATCLCRSV